MTKLEDQFASFTVYGVPQPQGSMRAFMPKGAKRPIVTSDNAKLKPWRQEVAAMAQEAMLRHRKLVICRPDAVRVEVDFFFQRPKSTKASVIHKTSKPDPDKLLRGLLDALTGICYEDDAQVCECQVTKGFDAIPHTLVRVIAL